MEAFNIRTRLCYLSDNVHRASVDYSLSGLKPFARLCMRPPGHDRVGLARQQILRAEDLQASFFSCYFFLMKCAFSSE